MKTNCRLSFNIVFTLFILSVFTWSCDKEVDPKLLPVLTTTEVIKMTEATAYTGGNITSDAGSDVTSRGVCWSETPNPTLEDNKTIDAAGTGVFESRIVGLNPSTTYYVRAYAANKKGVAYGLQVTFKTKSLTITTTPITSTTISSAVSGGTLETDGDSLNVSERGICWSTTTNPTIENSKTANGKGKGKYSASITQLQIATHYYARAYAKNETGTFYGDELSFITTNGTMTLTTTAATSITAISATVGGSVPNDGGATVTERGFCISKLPNPTITNKIANGSGVGAFASNITGLEANTTYYVRVFATNSVGTAYGNEISFSTKDGIVTLSTNTVSSITATSATSGGSITSDGGAAITARGLCWSTTSNPTENSNKSVNGSGIGNYNINITNLIPATKYYLRAFATNSVGTFYGSEVSFTTDDIIINFATTTPISISSISAVFNSDIISDGGSPITAKGVCWSTSSNPTINDVKIQNGQNTGSFKSFITGLSPNTNYYLRPYATNIYKTSYGEVLTFKTPDTVTDIDGNTYNTVKIGTQTWMTENLKTTKYRDGSFIANVSLNSAWVALSTGAFCYYSNQTDNGSKYGLLYNWYAVNDSRKISPQGWHIPTDAEWATLTTYLGGAYIAGGKLKQNGIINWVSPNTNATNETCFSAIPGGNRNSGNGLFYSLGSNACWWSATPYDTNYAYYRYIASDNGELFRSYPNKMSGYSVRCIID